MEFTLPKEPEQIYKTPSNKPIRLEGARLTAAEKELKACGLLDVMVARREQIPIDHVEECIEVYRGCSSIGPGVLHGWLVGSRPLPTERRRVKHYTMQEAEHAHTIDNGGWRFAFDQSASQLGQFHRAAAADGREVYHRRTNISPGLRGQASTPDPNSN